MLQYTERRKDMGDVWGGGDETKAKKVGASSNTIDSTTGLYKCSQQLFCILQYPKISCFPTSARQELFKKVDTRKKYNEKNVY